MCVWNWDNEKRFTCTDFSKKYAICSNQVELEGRLFTTVSRQEGGNVRVVAMEIEADGIGICLTGFDGLVVDEKGTSKMIPRVSSGEVTFSEPM